MSVIKFASKEVIQYVYIANDRVLANEMWHERMEWNDTKMTENRNSLVLSAENSVVYIIDKIVRRNGEVLFDNDATISDDFKKLIIGTYLFLYIFCTQ